MSRSEQRRTETTVSFRVTPQEAALIEGKASRHGLSAGQYAKMLALLDAGLSLPVVRRGPPRDASQLRELVGHIGKVGSNLNQIARAANTPGLNIDRQVLDQALEDLADVRSNAAAVLRIRDP